jgi:hypothetical protein
MEKLIDATYMILLAWLKVRGSVTGEAWTFGHEIVPEIPEGWYAVVKVELHEIGGEPKETV